MKNQKIAVQHQLPKRSLFQLSRFLFILFLAGFLFGNCTKDLCDEPDFASVRGVNFNINGKMIIMDPSGNNLAPLFQGERFRVKFWKKYCHGKVSDVFQYDYLTDISGNLIKQSFETRNFDMQNPQDVIEFVVYYVSKDGEEIKYVDGECRSYAWKPGFFSYDALGNMTIYYEANSLLSVDWTLGAVTISFD